MCFLAQGLEAHARMVLSLPSPSVSKAITVASAMPGIFCAVGNAKVYCFGVVCDESSFLGPTGLVLTLSRKKKTPIISTYYVINLSARVLQPATCLKPRSTRPGARFPRAKRGTVFAMASAQVRSRERSVVCLDLCNYPGTQSLPPRSDPLRACVLCVQAATCLKPRSTRPGARLRRAKRGTVFARTSAQVRSRESVGCDVMIVTNHGVERGSCLYLLMPSICDFNEHTRAEA